MKKIFLLSLIPAVAFGQVDTRIVDTIQQRGNPERVITRPEQPTAQPPRRPDAERPPVTRQAPMNPMMGPRYPTTWDDCVYFPPMYRDVCMNRGYTRSFMPMPRQTAARPMKARIRNATPQQRREIQQARREFKQKVERILSRRR